MSSWYHFSNCLTDLSAWSSSWSTFFFLDLGMILFRADCLSCGVGSLKDTMSSMSSITESHADGMIICQSHRKRTKSEPRFGLVMSAVYRNKVRVNTVIYLLTKFLVCILIVCHKSLKPMKCVVLDQKNRDMKITKFALFLVCIKHFFTVVFKYWTAILWNILTFITPTL